MMLEFASRRREIEGKCKRDSEERELQEDLQANCGSALKPLHPIKTPPPCCDVPLQALKAKFVWNKTWPNLVCLVVMSKSKRHWLNSSFGPDSPAWWCWPANYPSSWRDSCQTNWLTRQMTDGHAGCLDVWLNVWLAGCLAGWLAGVRARAREEKKKSEEREERRGGARRQTRVHYSKLAEAVVTGRERVRSQGEIESDMNTLSPHANRCSHLDAPPPIQTQWHRSTHTQNGE